MDGPSDPTLSSLLHLPLHLVGAQGTSLPPAPLHLFHTFPGSTWMVKACPGSTVLSWPEEFPS